MWVEEEGLVFVQCRDANLAPIEPCAEVAAHRPRFVWAARRASGEDWTLHSTACRHQDSQESSGDDKMLPYRVQARAPPHAIRTAGEPEDGARARTRYGAILSSPDDSWLSRCLQAVLSKV